MAGHIWKPKTKEDFQEGHAVQPEDELITAYVPETSAISGSDARISPGDETLGQSSEDDEEEDGGKGPEVNTPESPLSRYYRFCANSRTNTQDKCDKFGIAYADSLSPGGESDPDQTMLEAIRRQMLSEDGCHNEDTVAPLTF